MKKIFALLLLIAVSGCSGDDGPKDEHGLPLATQTGENTFGCLVNGEVFTPSGSSLSGPILDCSYQTYNEGYYFHVQGNRRNHGVYERVTLGTMNLQISEDETYQFLQYSEGNAWGGWADVNSLQFVYTSEQNTGELYISKLDMTKRIVSGTFWYDILLPDGEVIEIREGRFDMKF